MYLGNRVSSSFVRNVAEDDLNVKARRGEVLVESTTTAKVAGGIANGVRKAAPVVVSAAQKMLTKDTTSEVEATKAQPEVVKEIVYVDRIVEKEVFVPVPVESTDSNFFGDYIPDDMVSDVMSKDSEKVK